MQIKYSASVPYPEVTAALERVAAAGLHLEIEVTDPHWILKVCELPMLAKLGGTLRDKGIETHVQGPFYDLAPGSLDPFIREHTRSLFLRSVEIAGALNADCLTLYSGYNKVQHSRVIEQWFEVSLPLWQETVEAAERFDLKVLVANMFEDGPEIQKRIIGACPAESSGACLDLARAFGCSRKKISSWLRPLAESLRLVYLNDSRGKEDEHLSLGEGRVPFKEFFRAMMKKNLAPGIVFKMTVDQAVASRKTLRKLGLSQHQMELL